MPAQPPVCECGELTSWEFARERRYDFAHGSSDARALTALMGVYGSDVLIWACFGCGEWGYFVWPSLTISD